MRNFKLLSAACTISILLPSNALARELVSIDKLNSRPNESSREVKLCDVECYYSQLENINLKLDDVLIKNNLPSSHFLNNKDSELARLFKQFGRNLFSIAIHSTNSVNSYSFLEIMSAEELNKIEEYYLSILDLFLEDRQAKYFLGKFISETNDFTLVQENFWSPYFSQFFQSLETKVKEFSEKDKKPSISEVLSDFMVDQIDYFLNRTNFDQLHAYLLNSLTSLQNILNIVAAGSDNKNIFAFEKLDQKIKQKSLAISEKYVRNTENFHKNNKFFNFKGERLSDFGEIEFEEEFGLYFEEIGIQFSKIQTSAEFSVVKMAFHGQRDLNLNLKLLMPLIIDLFKSSSVTNFMRAIYQEPMIAYWNSFQNTNFIREKFIERRYFSGGFMREKWFEKIVADFLVNYHLVRKYSNFQVMPMCVCGFEFFSYK